MVECGVERIDVPERTVNSAQEREQPQAARPADDAGDPMVVDHTPLDDVALPPGGTPTHSRLVEPDRRRPIGEQVVRKEIVELHEQMRRVRGERGQALQQESSIVGHNATLDPEGRGKLTVECYPAPFLPDRSLSTHAVPTG